MDFVRKQLFRLATLLRCTLALATGLAPGTVDASRQAHEGPQSGVGWSTVRIDVGVVVDPPRGRFEIAGTIVLRLEAQQSFGPDLLTNTRASDTGEPGIRFLGLSAPNATVTIHDQLLRGAIQAASVRLGAPLVRGDTIAVSFRSVGRRPVRRMIVHDSAAMADWSNAWLPFPRPPAGELTVRPELFHAPGLTTLTLPRGWVGLVDGVLLRRDTTASGVVEQWRTPPGIARGFVAGPYHITRAPAAGALAQVYTLSEGARQSAPVVAERLGAAIDVHVARFGPLPFDGPYSVLEFPRLPLQSFGAVSEQTHLILQPPNFAYARDNIQLVAHEAAHAWWGNAVGTTGPGGLWVSEALAQMAAVLVIETLEGTPAMIEFLEFSRLGTDPFYSAAGYFALIRTGQDLPLATMGYGAGTHALANSKGVWVLHMLRGLIGDSTFSNVLRRAFTENRGSSLTAVQLRRYFVEAARDHEVEHFFAQWLDLPGAPVLTLEWHMSATGTAVLIQATQRQEGAVFQLPVELELTYASGETTRRFINLSQREQIFSLPVSSTVTSVALDPDRQLLIWRPSYGPPPVGEIDDPSYHTPADLAGIVVGTYRFEGFNRLVEVTYRQGTLYIQPAGAAPARLIPIEGGRFRVDGPGNLTAEFDISTTPAPSFVSVEGGGAERYLAKRVQPPN